MCNKNNTVNHDDHIKGAFKPRIEPGIYVSFLYYLDTNTEIVKNVNNITWGTGTYRLGPTVITTSSGINSQSNPLGW